MENQLVVRGNRILAHGFNRYISVNGTVIDTDSGKVYANSTVVECKECLPADIDSIGYEYHSGVFVPCAPYGEGTGTIAVLSSDMCKTIVDSGILVTNVGKSENGTYKGNGNSTKNLTFSFLPKVLLIFHTSDTYGGVGITSGATTCGTYVAERQDTINRFEVQWKGTTANLTSASKLNNSGSSYDYIAIG